MAITEGAIAAVAGADATDTNVTSASFDSTGGNAILFFVVHEGASTSYTWSDNKSTPGGQFTSLGTVNHGVGDLSISAVYFYRGSATWGTSHTVTVTFGATRPYRYLGGVVLNGSFGSTFLAATTQTASGTSFTVDAGSLVTDDAAYVVQFSGNYAARTLDTSSPPAAGWTVKDNATVGRHFQARLEAASGTFDPAHDISGSAEWVTIAAAIKESAVSGDASADLSGSASTGGHGTASPEFSIGL
jgi:hypothetical protein